ncbi:hypothetical protein ES319_1Z057800v1 [Gossypium barbadense]|uniref:Protein kinase domain-containing protein n=1 Tax=Gossypium barbadense TaxID=3634 RepID=A0A5J5NE35_GOSBA|nr:hypothetical protein ES319_1Z057800v1 [Gossypium barbadense]
MVSHFTICCLHHGDGEKASLFTSFILPASSFGFLFSSDARFCEFELRGVMEIFTDELGLSWSSDDFLHYGETASISVSNETRQQYMSLRHFPADSKKYCYKLNVVSRTRYLVRATFLYEKAELIFLATSPTISVCLSNATTGQPFISTLELRQFNGSIYYTPFEENFYLGVSARINFGADSEAPVRYPDDPFDRIWESDSLKRANYLVDVAAGTVKVSTNKSIYISSSEMPPEKVMQTAVVGTNGSLTYRLNLDGFPGFGWAFTLVLPGQPDLSKAVVNIQENAQGKYRIWKTSDSSKGPLLNAIEINRYLEKNDGSVDGMVIANVVALYPSADWAQEGGDPCLPVPWSWVRCNSDRQPKIVSILLSSQNLTGNIPSEFTKLSGWLDGNSLTGPIPDFTGCVDLRIIHLENNHLTGELPSSLMNLPNLRELYAGNINLHEGGGRAKHLSTIIVGSSGKKKHEQEQFHHPLPIQGQRIASSLSNAPTEAANCFTLPEIEDATNNFEKKIGSGGFGVVYYGKMKDGKEIAVKVLTSNSFQGKREFTNEVVSVLGFYLLDVSLLSRIHHRNLVQFLGYCQEDGRSMLVYEFMHNGTLKEHLYGPLTRERGIGWIKRLEICRRCCKGIEYIHTGCIPAIIHRDLKTSNILSRQAHEGKSSGTVGDLDPEYYISQQLTDKSDVYSFGVILLELIIQKQWHCSKCYFVSLYTFLLLLMAKLHIESGDIQGIIDPYLRNDYDIQSMWKIAEKALNCVQPHGHMRPSISEVLKEIQDAILIEKEGMMVREGNSDEMSRNSANSSYNPGSLDMIGTDNYLSLDESIARPVAR